MTLTKLIKTSTMGGVMLLGLNLLSQPAQAINWNFSYTATNNYSFTGTLISDGSSYVTNTVYKLKGISGTVTSIGGTGSINGISYFIQPLSSPYINEFFWNGTTMIALNNYGISFIDQTGFNYNISSQSGANTYHSTTDLLQTTFPRDCCDIDRYSITSSSLTPAAAVPWETDALSVIGSTILFGLGLWARNKFAKPLQK